MDFESDIFYTIFSLTINITEIINYTSPFLIIYKINHTEMTTRQIPSFMFFAFYCSSMIFGAIDLVDNEPLDKLIDAADFCTAVVILLGTLIVFAMFLKKKYDISMKRSFLLVIIVDMVVVSQLSYALYKNNFGYFKTIIICTMVTIRSISPITNIITAYKTKDIKMIPYLTIITSLTSNFLFFCRSLYLYFKSPETYIRGFAYSIIHFVCVIIDSLFTSFYFALKYKVEKVVSVSNFVSVYE